jgi:hypothetical protein
VKLKIAQKGQGMAGGNEPDELSAVGLCATCRHMRVMRSDWESVFYLRELSKVEHFPKYPGHNHGSAPVSCR